MIKNTMDKMQINQEGIVKIGLAEGTNVECILIALGEGMKAYRIKGATIGIRKEDAQMIEIE